jgi:deoxyadenosine/deoxycytidine kinase
MGASSSSALCQNKSTCTIVSIEGNIGSGKTTGKGKLKHYVNFLNKQKDSTIFVDEPTDEWESIIDSNGVTILVNLYSDIKRYAFRFQMMAYITRLKKIRDALRNPQVKIIITERCLLTDACVFAKMLYDSKHIEEDEYSIYTRWFHEFAQEAEPSCLIYFKASTDVCMNRIKKRNRVGEKDMQYEYLNQCNTYHDNWLITDPRNIIPVLVLNANEEDCDYSGHIHNYICEIRSSKIIGVMHHLKTYVNSSNNRIMNIHDFTLSNSGDETYSEMYYTDMYRPLYRTI